VWNQSAIECTAYSGRLDQIYSTCSMAYIHCNTESAFVAPAFSGSEGRSDQLVSVSVGVEWAMARTDVVSLLLTVMWPTNDTFRYFESEHVRAARYGDRQCYRILMPSPCTSRLGSPAKFTVLMSAPGI
jgi:hypothetical protein